MQPNLETLWDYQDPKRSERRFRQLLPQVKSDRAYHVELLTQIARAVCLQRRYEDAHNILDEAEALLAEGVSRPRMRCHLERSRILNDTGRTEESIAQADRARAIGEELGEHRLTADALHMIAYVVADDEEAVRWHNVAIDFCRKHLTDERIQRWLLTLHINVGDKYEALGRFAEGIDSVSVGIGMAEKLGLTTKVLAARCLLARLHRLDGRLDEAMTIIEEVAKSGFDQGWLYEEYAECLLAAGRKDESTAQFGLAYERFSNDPWFPPTEPARLERIKNLARLEAQCELSDS
ncbi:MAG: hypothetical protein MJE77_15250 [Proteobacteria bacterium]|nr:hypothetical protein [Pseudomonadota bacterium]